MPELVEQNRLRTSRYRVDCHGSVTCGIPLHVAVQQSERFPPDIQIHKRSLSIPPTNPSGSDFPDRVGLCEYIVIRTVLFLPLPLEPEKHWLPPLPNPASQHPPHNPIRYRTGLDVPLQALLRC